MKKLFWILIIMLFPCCEKETESNPDLGLNNIQGTWNWTSTCGGLSGGCYYPTINHYSKMYFDTVSAIYIDTNFYDDTFNVILAEYSLTKSDKNNGSILVKEHFEYTISILDNTLTIHHGNLHDT